MSIEHHLTVADKTVSLDDFLPTAGTRSAWQAVTELAGRLAAGRRPAVNPLTLHGPPGTGKTHLARGLVKSVVGAELSAAADLARTGIPEGASRCPLWIVEDLQHLAPRVASELDGLIDARLRRRQATVFTGSGGPSRLPLSPRLASRLAAGLVVPTEPPTRGERVTLMNAWTAERAIRIDPEAVAWLAERIAGTRPLAGAVQTLMQLARTSPHTIDRATVERLWADDPTTGRPSLDRVVRHVADYFAAEPKRLTARGRSPGLDWPRQMAMALAHAFAGSATQVGTFFGGRDASTVRLAARTVARKVAADAGAANDWRRLTAVLGGAR